MDSGALAAIANTVSKLPLRTFRSSRSLKSALKYIIENYVTSNIKNTWSRHSFSFSMRLSALMKLAVSYLCVPTISAILGFASTGADVGGEDESVRKKLVQLLIEIFGILLDCEEALMLKGK